jgi:DNA-binding ferritin-like protein
MTKLPLALVVALLVAGCGGDDSSSDSGTTATTSASDARGYAETGQALDDICKRAKAEVDPIAEKATGNARKDAELLAQVVEANEKYVAEVKEIEPDPKLADAFNRYVAELDELTIKQREVLDVAEQGDDTAYQTSAEALSGADAEANRIARELGASECAKG